MPTFGDYETIGEPVAVAEERGHVSTVWQARKHGAADGRLFAIKCFRPHAQPGGGTSSQDTLARDRGLDFLEGIKQLKKAQSEGGRCLAPVHDLGMSVEGAWYATDFYPRTLKTFITLRGRVDSAALRQVVTNVVSGCLALKRSRGHSHGNLKTGNVYLVGKPRPLRQTPVHLADPYPASPVELARLDAGDQQAVGSLLQQVVEAQDLRGIGELILQLVEGRLVRSAYDYNYPVPASPAWDKLGKDGERWRELCNRLLDPQLSPDKVSLETLAREFRQKIPERQLRLAIIAAVAVAVLGGGSFGLVKWRQSKRAANYQAAMEKARDELGATNLVVAAQQVTLALKWKPGDSAAAALKDEIATRTESEYAAVLQRGERELNLRNLDAATEAVKAASLLKPADSRANALQSRIQNEQSYRAALDAGNRAFTRHDFIEAQARADEALTAKPKDPAALKLKAAANEQVNISTAAARQQTYDAAMSAGRAAYDRKDYAEAVAQANRASGIKPGDAGALKLKGDAEARQNETLAEADRERKLAAAIAAGRAAFDRQDYDTALAQANLALGINSHDATALKLKADTETRQKELLTQREVERRYKLAMDTGKAAFERREYDVALTQATAALGEKPGDPAATKLKTDAQAAQKEVQTQAEREKTYRDAIDSARAAYRKKDFEGTLTQVSIALGIRENDATALKLKADAESGQKEALAQAERDRNYQRAMQAGQAAYDRRDYAAALEQANVALGIRDKDSAALKLKSDAEAGQKEELARAEREKNFKQAMESGQAAYDKKDYTTALAQANLAIGINSTNAAALKLKTDIEARQREIAAQAERDRSYAQAMQSAQAAFGRKDYDTAIAQAAAALSARPNDAAAGDLRNRATNQKDLQTAQTYFSQGDFDKALAVCSTHNGVQAFDALKQSIQEKGKEMIRLDAEFQKYLVWFNVLRAKDKYIQAADARQASVLGAIGNQRDQYLARVKWLESEFSKNGWLTQNDRQKYMEELKRNIGRWD